MKRIVTVLLAAMLFAGIFAAVPTQAATKLSVAGAKFKAWDNADCTACFISTKKQDIFEFQYMIYNNSMKRIKTAKSEVYYSTSNDIYDVCLVEGLPKWSCSFVTVRARRSTGAWSAWSPKICIVPYLKNSLLHASQVGTGRKAKISWGKVAGATDYLVYMSTSGTGGWKKIATVKGDAKSRSVVVSSFNGSSFVKNKKYYYKVIARRKYQGKYYNSRGNSASSACAYFWFY